MLIVIEGIDGCGKSTVARGVAERLHGKLIRFPADDTATGPVIREYLRESPSVLREHGDLVIQALCMLNRYEKWDEINRLVRDGVPVVLDRYWQSGWVYGEVAGLPESINEMAKANLRVADLNILLDVPAPVCFERIKGRNSNPERYESLDRLAELSEAYRELWSMGPTYAPGSAGGWCTIGYELLSSPMRAIDVVHGTIEDMLGSSD